LTIYPLSKNHDLIPMNQRYLLFDNYGIRGIDRISIPAFVSGKLRREMLKLYVPHRFTAKIAWNLTAFSRSFADIFRFRKQTSGPSSRLDCLDWVGWVKEVHRIIGGESIIPAFYFPPQDYRKKCSILLFDAGGRPVSYVKMAWGEEEKDQAVTEREAYSFCHSQQFRKFETPTILFKGEFEGRYFNLFSVFPLDLGLAPNYWNEVYQQTWDELSASTVRQIKLENLPWWDRRRRWNHHWDRAHEIVEKLEPETGYRFCTAHGDFSPWNARVRSNRLFLFDWERFEKTAPLFLDPVYWILSHEILLRKEKDVRTIAKSLEFDKRIKAIFHPQIPDLMLVLIYLRSNNPEEPFRKVLDDLMDLLVTLSNS
jgi:hypothetical protein